MDSMAQPAAKASCRSFFDSGPRPLRAQSAHGLVHGTVAVPAEGKAVNGIRGSPLPSAPSVNVSTWAGKPDDGPVMLAGGVVQSVLLSSREIVLGAGLGHAQIREGVAVEVPRGDRGGA